MTRRGWNEEWRKRRVVCACVCLRVSAKAASNEYLTVINFTDKPEYVNIFLPTNSQDIRQRTTAWKWINGAMWVRWTTMKCTTQPDDNSRNNKIKYGTIKWNQMKPNEWNKWKKNREERETTRTARRNVIQAKEDEDEYEYVAFLLVSSFYTYLQMISYHCRVIGAVCVWLDTTNKWLLFRWHQRMCACALYSIHLLNGPQQSMCLWNCIDDMRTCVWWMSSFRFHSIWNLVANRLSSFRMSFHSRQRRRRRRGWQK